MLSSRAIGPLLVSLLVSLAVLGCGGPMGRAVHEYESTRYPEALHALERMESDASQFEPDARARYSLYRGLAHLSVGNARLASRWLGRARFEIDEDPTRLSAIDTSRLESAWRSLGLMPGEAVIIE